MIIIYIIYYHLYDDIIAPDAIFSSSSSVDGGETLAQVFFDMRYCVRAVYQMKLSEGKIKPAYDFLSCFQDFVLQ